MNFLDTFDIASPVTPDQANNSTQESTQSLNDEVTQVVGQLSRFWGGFRKQSQTVFETAKKDLEEVYTQAQKEINKLTAEEPEASTSAAATTDAIPSSAADSLTDSPHGSDEDESDGRKLHTAEGTQAMPSTSSGHMRTVSQNFFHRLQSSLPPSLVSSVQNVQNQLPESLKQGDFTQLRTSLTTEFQRVHGITRVQAEEYVHKSEGLLREAQEFLKDAVKVVPPDEAEGSENASVALAGTLWDGTDLWMLPDVGTSSTKPKDKEAENPRAEEGLRAVATRAESLLKQLRHDPGILKVDPMADERAKALYEQWIRDKVATEEGRIGGKHWTEESHQALSDPVDGSALRSTHNALVPEHITTETFWTRYFFRVHQVQQDEQRRKALVQGMAVDEDLSWEDDDDDDDEVTTSAAAKPAASEKGAAHSLRASVDTLQAPRVDKGLSSEQSSPRTSDADLSRRQSSDGSYDVVSSQVSASGDPPVSPEETRQARDDDGEEEDSDWE